MRRAGRALAAVVALVALAAVVLWSSWRLGPEPSVEATGLSAMWARHQWVGEAHSEQEYDELAAQLRELELTDVFFHVGPLAADGCIPPERYPEADELAAALERRVPEVRVQAWIGQVEMRGGGPLDIGDVSVRERIVGEAERFLELGFDGVHYDIEPWFPGDERYLALLTATREVTQPRGAVLSVSSIEIEPFRGASRLLRSVVRRGALWTPGTYAPMAALVDQVAVMTYDTAMPFDWLFGPLVAQQTRAIAGATGDATVFIGVPSYEEPNIGHHPRAENVATGLRGVRHGLERLAPEDRARVGVAVYAEWTTDAGEWDDYRAGWLEAP